MKFIICGAGTVGLNIAQYLEAHNNDVVIIDNRSDLVKQITETLDVQTVYGCASDPEVLRRAGAATADMIIAVTAVDEVNIVVCEVAALAFQIPKRLARVRNQLSFDPAWSWLFEKNALRVDAILRPEVDIAQKIVDNIAIPGVLSLYSMLDQRIVVAGIKCTAQSVVVNTPIAYINSLFPAVEFNVVALYRKGEFLLPTLHDKILDGDEVYFVCRQEDTERAAQAFYTPQKSSRRFLIIGGGNIGSNLVRLLSDSAPDLKVKMIERNPERARYLSRELPDTTVYQGDGLDPSILHEVGVKDVEAVITLTEDDKTNCLAALLAKQHGARRSIALTTRSGFGDFISSLGVDSVLYPPAITMSSVLRHIKRHNLCTQHILREGAGELVEVEIEKDGRLRGVRIGSLTQLPHRRIIALMRAGEIEFPQDDLILEPEDRLILLVHRLAVEGLETAVMGRAFYS